MKNVRIGKAHAHKSLWFLNLMLDHLADLLHVFVSLLLQLIDISFELDREVTEHLVLHDKLFVLFVSLFKLVLERFG